MTPKLIALKTGLNVNTVKSLLPKIGGIKKAIRGLYKVVKQGDSTQLELFDWNFHNIILSLSPVQSVDKVDSFDFLLGRGDLSVVRGKAVYRVSTDFPLNVSSIAYVASHFALWFGRSLSDVFVSTVEFNHDFKNLRLDGVRCITVDSLVSQFKAYQKRVGLRVEHKTKVPLSVENVVDMLSSQVSHTDLHVKLSEHRLALERLSVAVGVSVDLSRRLLERV